MMSVMSQRNFANKLHWVSHEHQENDYIIAVKTINLHGVTKPAA